MARVSWILQETLDLKLPGLQCHEDHQEKNKFRIQVFWAEFLCYACTDCPVGMVGERFYQVPSTIVHRMFRTSRHFNRRTVIRLLTGYLRWLSLHTWRTLNDDLYSSTNPTVQARLPPQPKNKYPKNHIFVETFGEEKVKQVTDSLQESPTTGVVRDLATEIKEIVEPFVGSVFVP